jgi:hypothetical protein
VTRLSKLVLKLMKVRFEEEFFLYRFSLSMTLTSLHLVSFNDAVSASYYTESNGKMTAQ